MIVPQVAPFIALALAGVGLLTAGMAHAQVWQAVTDRDVFIGLVSGRELHLGQFGVNLAVQPDGTIEGNALGSAVTGEWSWQDGFFCREIDWSGMAIGYNCQLVEVAGSEIRFTVDQGAGRSAAFTLR